MPSHEHDLLENLFFYAPDLLCVADLKRGQFLLVNPSFTRVLGYTMAELKGRSFMDLVHKDDREATQREVGKLSSGGKTLGFRNRYISANGEIVTLDWWANAVPSQGLSYATARPVCEDGCMCPSAAASQLNEALDVDSVRSFLREAASKINAISG